MANYYIHDGLSSFGLGLKKTIASNITRDRLILVIVSIGTAALFFATANNTILQSGSLDPYVYAAYIHDYTGTFARYGLTYYSTRIAYIYPDRFFAWAFGIKNGYFLLRLVFLSAASASVFSIARRFYGISTAAFAAVWLCFIPWLPRSLLWTHYDGFATVYLLIAAACLIAPTRRIVLGHMVAGAAYALAVNCNLLLLAIGGLFAPSWFILNRQRGFTWIVRHGCAALAGFASAYLVLVLIFSWFVQRLWFSLEITTWRMTFGLLIKGGAANWFVPLSQSMKNGIVIPLIPAVLFLVLVASVFTGATKRTPISEEKRDFRLATLVYLGSVIALVLFLHYVFKVAFLSLFYYLVYFVPACALALIVLFGEIECAGYRGRIFVGGVSLTIVMLWLAQPLLPLFLLFSSIEFWLGFGLLAITVGICRFKGASALTATIIVAMTFCVFQTNGYSTIRDSDGSKNQSDWDLYKGAVFLQRFVNLHVGTKEPLGFWYSNDPSAMWLNSAQSMFLWGFSRLAPPTKEYPGMPLVDDKFRSAIVSKPIIALLGLANSDVNEGLAALTAARIPYREIQRTTFKGEQWDGYSVAIVDTRPPPSLEPSRKN